MVQAHIIYAGRVQGVGFRFTVQSFASDLGLKGWVKNLPDGRVELLAEGPKEFIDDLCQKVEDFFKGFIRLRDIEWTEGQGILKDFQIVY